MRSMQCRKLDKTKQFHFYFFLSSLGKNLPCESNPCQNGGTCVNLENENINIYQCICAEGFTGTNCEKRKNHCGCLQFILKIRNV